jgi:hypothetical protein
MRKDDIESYHNDKAVQDNIVESWLCVDCGVNTNPGSPSGPEARIDFALTGESTAVHSCASEVYHVNDVLWKQAGMRPWNGCLCVGCLEKRIGRQLRPRDFARHDKKVWARLPCTERLRNRRGYETDGAREVTYTLEVAPAIAGSFMEAGA